jgi:hypothetical protein
MVARMSRFRAGLQHCPKPVIRRDRRSENALGQRHAEGDLQTVVELDNGKAVEAEITGQVALQAHSGRVTPVEVGKNGLDLIKDAIGVAPGPRGHGTTLLSDNPHCQRMLSMVVPARVGLDGRSTPIGPYPLPLVSH